MPAATFHTRHVQVRIGTTRTFYGSVSNAVDRTVTWYVNNVKGGNATVGTIDSQGRLHATGDAARRAVASRRDNRRDRTHCHHQGRQQSGLDGFRLLDGNPAEPVPVDLQRHTSDRDHRYGYRLARRHGLCCKGLEGDWRSNELQIIVGNADRNHGKG